MANSVRFNKSSAFPELTNVSEARWASLSGLISVAFRPPNRVSDSFAEHGLTLLFGLTMFVMRWQYAMRSDVKKLQRGAILQALKFAYDVHSGQVYVDAKQNDECSAAIFDCAIPRSKWGVFRHHLDPAHNKTAADLAIAMSREANRALDAGEPIPHQPTLPDFFLAFPQRPVFERGALIKREASAAFGVAADEIPDADLEEFFWAQSFEFEGYIMVPQRHFARQGEYPVHPVDGSVRPEIEGAPGQWQGLWYFGDGRWNPAAQRPHRVYAHMGNVLGRQFRNPAFTVLKANSFLPADMTYPQFMAAPDIDGLHVKIIDALDANSTVCDLLVTSMRQALGRNSDMATDDDLKMALDRPDRPLNLSYAAGVRLVRYSAPPCPDSLTWRRPGVAVDLFSTKRVWEQRVAPFIGQLVGGPVYGRASAPART